jgi:sulfate permease, SulP family
MVANLVVTQNEVRPEKLFVVGSGDFFAGLISSVLAVAVGLSFAALIFSGPLSPWLAYGVAATFVTSAISALVLAIGSSLPFVIAGPDAPTATVTATLAAASRIVANGAPDGLFAPVLLVVAVSAILSGVLLCVIGVSRASGFIRASSPTR